MVPGGYVAKFSLPLFCVLIAIAVGKKNRAGLFSGFIGLLSVSVSVLTGERGNFLIRACGGMMAGLFWKPKFMLYTGLVIIEIIAILVVTFARPDLSSRFGEKFIENIPILNASDSNVYWGAWRGGIQQGLLTPIKGIGPSGTRKTCEKLNTKLPQWLPGSNYCGNHPHNFYIQLFAEVGIIGLLIGIVMFISLVVTCFKARLNNFNVQCLQQHLLFLLLFSFFTARKLLWSMGNLFMWFAIGFAVAQYQG